MRHPFLTLCMNSTRTGHILRATLVIVAGDDPGAGCCLAPYRTRLLRIGIEFEAIDPRRELIARWLPIDARRVKRTVPKQCG